MNTYINIKESNAIKAIALLLIIFSHNHYLTPINSILQYWIYSFHVVVFFILPLFYKHKEENLHIYIYKLTKRCLIPYTLFYFICFIIATISQKIDNVNTLRILYGYFHLNGISAKEAVGFQFIWFIPCYYIFSIIRILGEKNKYLKLSFFLLGVWISFIDADEQNILFKYGPFYIPQAIWYYTLGITAFYLNKHIRNFREICSILFIISSFIFIHYEMFSISTILSISGFFMIWLISHYIYKFSIIQLIGTSSFPIYIYNVFIYHLINMIFPENLFWQITCYMLTVILCILFAIFSRKTKMNDVLFPR